MIQRIPLTAENIAAIHGIFCQMRMAHKGLGYFFDSLGNGFFAVGMKAANAIIATKFPQSTTFSPLVTKEHYGVLA